MSLLYRSLLVLFSILPLTANAQVQNGNEISVEISKEKTIINGRTYYLHTVKKGENIYRISKAYKVTQKDIIIANPEAISGSIKDGQVIKIPADSSAPKNIQQIESNNFIYHITEEQQTIYFLTQKYKITDQELYKYNPELEFSQLQVGQVVKIPKSPNVPVGAEKFRPIEKYIEHKVARKETKYSIAKEYNITVDELIAANPILNTEDLQKGQTLQIPVKSTTEIVSVPVVKPDSGKTRIENLSLSAPGSCDGYKPFSETINVAILLPIFLDGTQTLAMIDSVNNFKEKRNVESNEIYQIASNLMKFYQGALLAIDSLKKRGLSVKLYVYDTGKDNNKINSILAKPEMTGMNLIIGPLTKNPTALEKTAQFALNNKIKMVSPFFSEDKLVINNPFVFQIMPGEAEQASYVTKYISTLPEKTTVILVNSNSPKDKEIFDIYKNKLESILPNKYKVFNYTPKKLPALLSKTDMNVIIMPSEQPATIQYFLTDLNNPPRKESIMVFGLSSWTIMRGLEQDYLHNIEFQYPSAFLVDFNSLATQNFLSKYRYFYKSEPYFQRESNTPQYFSKEGYNFAFLGYDITLYFLSSMAVMGKNFENCIGQQKFDLLHTSIIFQRLNPQGGFINEGINIIKYTKDYSIVKAK